jgi:N-acetylmuramoyl-L-alanine amidase
MARHRARGLWVMMVALLLPGGLLAEAYLPIAALARQFGLKTLARDGGAEATLTGGGGHLEFSLGSREARWNGYRLFLGEAPVMRGRNLALAATDWQAIVRPLVVPTSTPDSGRLRLVVIDPGHGGSDPGSENRERKMKEKTYTRDVAQRLARVLLKKGYRVLLTRRGDTRLKPTQAADLRARAEKARRAGADLFVSLHFNSLAANPAVRGIETYALTPAGQRSTATAKREASDRTAHPGNRHDHWSMVLCAQVHHQLVRQLAAVDRGLKHARFAVLRPLDCPAILVEGGFLSNAAEAEKIGTPAYRQKMAEAIGTGIANYAVLLRAATTASNQL